MLNITDDQIREAAKKAEMDLFECECMACVEQRHPKIIAGLRRFIEIIDADCEDALSAEVVRYKAAWKDAIRLVEAKEKLLMAYRLGKTTPERALDTIHKFGSMDDIARSHGLEE